MPRPRPPSRLEGVGTPVFGMYWYADPGTGTSIIAFCGGGGSAATGVKNVLKVQFGLEEGSEPITVSTGQEVGAAVTVAKNPITNKLSLFCALGHKVHVYSLNVETSQCTLEQEVSVGDNMYGLATNAMVDRLAVTTESGPVKVYEIVADYQVKELASFECEGHSKTSSAVAFAPRSNLMVSSGKDGTARIWKDDECVSVLTCSITDPKAPPPKRPQQVLVRGCAFADLDGKWVFTVASGKKGRAFLSKWGLDEAKGQYECVVRTPCSDYPISAMSISADGASLALGSTNGDIILWNVEKWKSIKFFPEVHGLPVTCIAARPYAVPLQGEEGGGTVRFDAISASADSLMGWLTVQRRGPKSARQKAASGPPVADYVNKVVMYMFFCWVLSPLVQDLWRTCGKDGFQGVGKTWTCVRDDFFIAPMSRPGIAVPPH
jgi:hypothetical protein